MVEVTVKLTEDDINLLRQLLINEIQDLEFDKEKCKNDIDFVIIAQNLHSHINHANKLCKKICKAYMDEVIKNGKV